MAHTVTITGATGNIGGRLAEQLLERGVRVRAVGRSEDRLAPLVAKGAEPRAGDLTDAGFLADAFRDADAVFLMIPPHYTAVDFRAYQRGIVESFVEALRETKLPRAVVLSSLGAELAEGTGPIAGLHELEERLAEVPGLSLVVLRPAYFMENFLSSIPTLKADGVHVGVVGGGVPIPLVATRDIADVAAEYLADPSFAGHDVRELLGPRDVTIDEATSILGAAVGRSDLSYVVLPEKQYRQGLIGVGLSENVADEFIEMGHALDGRRIRSLAGRDERTATPTTLEQFAREVFAPAYSAI